MEVWQVAASLWVHVVGQVATIRTGYRSHLSWPGLRAWPWGLLALGLLNGDGFAIWVFNTCFLLAEGPLMLNSCLWALGSSGQSKVSRETPSLPGGGKSKRKGQ